MQLRALLTTLTHAHPCPLLPCFSVSSKTFTTAETMLNARTVRAWLTERLGPEAVAKHMVAVRWVASNRCGQCLWCGGLVGWQARCGGQAHGGREVSCWGCWAQ